MTYYMPTIITRDQFLEFVDSFEPDSRGLFVFVMRDYASKIKSGDDPTEEIQWYNARAFQSQYIGQIIYFTDMEIGSQHALVDVPIKICPLCGRPGAVHDGEFQINHKVYSTDHVYYVSSESGKTPLDECSWGSGWGHTGYEDGMRIVQQPIYQSGVGLLQFNREQNFGLDVYP